MKPIMKGIYLVEGLRLGNVYVIEASDGLTLVDTSVPGSLARIERDFRSAGRKLKDIKGASLPQTKSACEMPFFCHASARGSFSRLICI